MRLLMVFVAAQKSLPPDGCGGQLEGWRRHLGIRTQKEPEIEVMANDIFRIVDVGV